MAFRDFTFPEVFAQLGLSVRDAVLFPNPPTVSVRPEFLATLHDGIELAAAISTEKAKSEFIIAPILLELHRNTGRRFKLFSGTDWRVDPARGLTGYCDFILTWGASQFFVSAPFAVIVEAKNDLYVNGFGQCIAAMYAASIANEKAGLPSTPIYGAVTHGSAWKFLRFEDKVLTIDHTEYLISDLPHIFGVLDLITRVPASMAA